MGIWSIILASSVGALLGVIFGVAWHRRHIGILELLVQDHRLLWRRYAAVGELLEEIADSTREGSG